MSEQQAIVLPAGDLLPDRNGPLPLYFQLASGIEKAIYDGGLPPGSRLENELSLSHRLGLSRPTVRRAIQDLVEKGLLVRRRGIGTQVVHGAVSRPIELTSLYDDLERSGRTPTTRLMEVGQIPAEGRVAEQLGVEPGTPVVRLSRVRLSDNVPISLLENYLAPALMDLAQVDFEKVGLYRALRDRGVTLSVARQRIGARKATPTESKLLDLDRGAPVLTMDRTAYDTAGVAAEYGHHCYRPDLYSFEMTLVNR